MHTPNSPNWNTNTRHSLVANPMAEWLPGGRIQTTHHVRWSYHSCWSQCRSTICILTLHELNDATYLVHVTDARPRCARALASAVNERVGLNLFRTSEFNWFDPTSCLSIECIQGSAIPLLQTVRVTLYRALRAALTKKNFNLFAK